MGPIFYSLPHLRLANLIIFWCEADMIAQTFLVVIKVGRKNKLRLFTSAEYTGRDTNTNFDVLRLCCEDLYKGGSQSF